MRDEYQKRHDEIWLGLAGLLRDSGISDYSIFLNKSTNTLFGVLKITDPTIMDKLPEQPMMQRCLAYMKDSMSTNPGNSPASTPLE